MRVRVATASRFVFGTYLWGLAPVAVQVLPGSVLTGERVQAGDADAPAPVVVSSPVYVEEPNGDLTAYRLRDAAQVEEHALTAPGSRAAFEAFVGGMGVEDLVLPSC